MMLPIVRYAPVIYMAVMTIFALLLMPGVAMAGDHIDPDGYVDSYMNQNHLGTDSSTMLENNQFDTYHGGEVLPGFDQIGSYMSGLMLGFIPVLFVIKFAGRAMLSITHSGDARGPDEQTNCACNLKDARRVSGQKKARKPAGK